MVQPLALPLPGMFATLSGQRPSGILPAVFQPTGRRTGSEGPTGQATGTDQGAHTSPNPSGRAYGRHRRPRRVRIGIEQHPAYTRYGSRIVRKDEPAGTSRRKSLEVITGQPFPASYKPMSSQNWPCPERKHAKSWFQKVGFSLTRLSDESRCQYCRHETSPNSHPASCPP